MSKRPKLSDVADEIARIGRADEPPEKPPAEPSEPAQQPEDYWRKTTVTLRREQFEELEGVLAQWAASKRVKVSLAEVLRLAVDVVLEQMDENADEVILALHRQEQREERESGTRKYGRSRGAERYLRERGLL